MKIVRPAALVAVMFLMGGLLHATPALSQDDPIVGRWTTQIRDENGQQVKYAGVVEVTANGDGSWSGVVVESGVCWSAGDPVWTITSVEHRNDGYDIYRGEHLPFTVTESPCPQNETTHDASWIWNGGSLAISFYRSDENYDYTYPVQYQAVKDPTPATCPTERPSSRWRPHLVPGRLQSESECKAKFGPVKFSMDDRLARIKEDVVPIANALQEEEKGWAENLERVNGEVKALEQECTADSQALKDLRARAQTIRAGLSNGASRATKDELDALVSEIRVAEQKYQEDFKRLEAKADWLWTFERHLINVQGRKSIYAEPLALTDFRIRGIEVWAGEQIVYKVTYSDSYGRLRALNHRIDQLVKDLDESKKKKALAFTEFQIAHKNATAELAKIADLIKVQAYYRAGVRGVKDLVDVLKATAEGGVPAVGAEALKKLFEYAYEYTTEISGPVGDPNPFGNDPVIEEVEKKFKEAMGSTVVGAGSRDLAVDKGLLDPIKEALLTDPAEAVLCKAFYEKVGQACEAGHSSGPVLERIGKDAIHRVKRMRARLDLLDKRLTIFQKLDPVAALSSLGKRAGEAVVKKGIDIAHDAAEVFFNKQFDEDEMKAWYKFVHRDLVARQKWGLWQAELEAQDTLIKELKGLLVDKATLLNGWDEDLLAHVVKDASFDLKGLDIVISYERTQTAIEPLPVQVSVSGLSASPGTVEKQGERGFVSRGNRVSQGALLTLPPERRRVLELELK